MSFKWINQMEGTRDGLHALRQSDASEWPWWSEVLSPGAIAWGLKIGIQAAEDTQRARSQIAVHFGHEVGDIEQQAAISGVLNTLAVLVDDPGDWETPRDIKAHARDAFLRGIPLPSTIRFVWMHHNKVQEALLMEQRVAESSDDAGELQELYLRTNAVVEKYIADIVDEYRLAESEHDGASPERVRNIVVSLFSPEPSLESVGQRIGVNLDLPYRVLLAGHRDASKVLGDREFVLSTIATVARKLSSEAVLVQELDHCSFAILRRSQTGKRPVRERAVLPPHLVVGYSTESKGRVSGDEQLRDLTASADLSLRIARRPERSRSAADIIGPDVGQLFQIVSTDQQELRHFVGEVLGDLALDSRRYTELRETLLVYLVAGRSRKSAGAKLNLAPNTVAYRVDHALRVSKLDLDDVARVSDAIIALRILVELPSLCDVSTKRMREER